MNIYLAVIEGGHFTPKHLIHTGKPATLCKRMRHLDWVIVFKCGMIYDGFLKKRGYTPWRHKLSGGRRAGKKLYKELDLIHKK